MASLSPDTTAPLHPWAMTHTPRSALVTLGCAHHLGLTRPLIPDRLSQGHSEWLHPAILWSEGRDPKSGETPHLSAQPLPPLFIPSLCSPLPFFACLWYFQDSGTGRLPVPGMAFPLQRPVATATQLLLNTQTFGIAVALLPAYLEGKCSF